MEEIFKIIFWVIVCIIVYKIAFIITKRCFLVSKLRTLRATCDATLSFRRCPMASFFHISAEPDAVVEIGNTLYLVRFISGISNRRNIHFASENFFVIYKDFKLAPGGIYPKGYRLKKQGAPTVSVTSSRHVRIMPNLVLPEEYATYEKSGIKKIVRILVFNPTPKEVSYVSEERTSVKAAFSQDEIYGYKIFTASTFVEYAERTAREKSDRILNHNNFIETT